MEVDLFKLQSRLEVERPIDALGFTQIRFDPCKLGLPNSKCRTQRFSLIHFQILCRNSVGTTDYVANYELEPLVTELEWKIRGESGFVETDQEGFGQIRLLTKKSVKKSRLILIHGDLSLGLRIASTKKIIVPDDWCN